MSESVSFRHRGLIFASFAVRVCHQALGSSTNERLTLTGLAFDVHALRMQSCHQRKNLNFNGAFHGGVSGQIRDYGNMLPVGRKITHKPAIYFVGI